MRREIEDGKVKFLVKELQRDFKVYVQVGKQFSGYRWAEPLSQIVYTENVDITGCPLDSVKLQNGARFSSSGQYDNGRCNKCNIGSVSDNLVM